MAQLSERGQGSLTGFLKRLAEVVGSRKQAVLVVTDPADQWVYSKESAKLGAELSSSGKKLDELFGRKMSDFDPIGDESARVIVRRLFENVDPAATQAASAAYHALYERVTLESPGAVPPGSADYAKKIVECYPFHPRLLETAQGRLVALQDFQKSRGTLRLFARILRTIWEEGRDLDLITAGDIDWSSDRIQADLLQRLNRDNFKSAVSSDIEKHAKELDGGAQRGIHVRVASALLLESIPMQSNSGLDPSDLTLAVLRPDEAGHEPSEALDRLVGVCWHTYPMPGGRGWQFRYEPNIIKQIEERMTDIPLEDARGRVLSEAQGYFSGPAFKVAAWPTNARQVQEASELQLALCEDEKIANAVCMFSDDTDQNATIPRRFRNAILAVTATTTTMNVAVDCAQRLLAAEAIEREHKTGETGKLVREQLKRILPDFQKRFRVQTCRSFDKVVLTGGISYQMEEQFQVPEEKILQKAHGQASLRQFLDAKNLIYQPGDTLDTARFIKDILPGTTPLFDKPQVYTAKAVHERFLAAPGLRLIPDGSIVRQTVLKAITDKKVVVKLPDGRAYDAKGCIEGPEGRRRRIPGTLTTLSLDESVMITIPGSPEADSWTKEDTRLDPSGPGPGPGPNPPPPPVLSRLTATTWEEVLKYVAERPLLELQLTTGTPASAASLAGLLQPLGAESLSLSVNVGGDFKDEGLVDFAASGFKLNHPTKPLHIAQTIFNALAEGGTYDATITASFGTAGRTGIETQLKDISENAPNDITPKALFDKPAGAA